ncbi:MAG: hypothetical protein QUV10_10365 [Paracoccaceae bacterium]|nr:hypothetical protein [Paracoccaceae bacterium]
MSYQYSPEHFGLLEADHSAPIILPSTSRAERNVPRASAAHCTVNSVLGRDGGTRFQSESLLEFRHKLILDSLGNVADMREQVRFRYGWQDEHEVVFDLFLVLHDGTRLAGDVKPEVRLRSGRHLNNLQEVAWWVRENNFADEVRLFTDADIDPVELFNAHVFHAVGDLDPEADTAAIAIAATLQGGRNLRDLAAEIGMQTRGYKALIRLLASNVLRTFGHVRITPDTVVAMADRAAARALLQTAQERRPVSEHLDRITPNT